jgi:hypothetical protein
MRRLSKVVVIAQDLALDWLFGVILKKMWTL